MADTKKPAVAVEVKEPFYKETWFWGALGIVAGAAGGYIFAKHKKQKALIPILVGAGGLGAITVCSSVFIKMGANSSLADKFLSFDENSSESTTTSSATGVTAAANVAPKGSIAPNAVAPKKVSTTPNEVAVKVTIDKVAIKKSVIGAIKKLNVAQRKALEEYLNFANAGYASWNRLTAIQKKEKLSELKKSIVDFAKKLDAKYKFDIKEVLEGISKAKTEPAENVTPKGSASRKANEDILIADMMAQDPAKYKGKEKEGMEEGRKMLALLSDSELATLIKASKLEKDPAVAKKMTAAKTKEEKSKIMADLGLNISEVESASKKIEDAMMQMMKDAFGKGMDASANVAPKTSTTSKPNVATAKVATKVASKPYPKVTKHDVPAPEVEEIDDDEDESED